MEVRFLAFISFIRQRLIKVGHEEKLKNVKNFNALKKTSIRFTQVTPFDQAFSWLDIFVIL